MRGTPTFGILLAIGLRPLAAQQDERGQLDMTFGHAQVHCNIGKSHERGACAIGLMNTPPLALSLSMSKGGRSSVLFSVDNVSPDHDVTVRIDTFPPHTAAHAMPFGYAESAVLDGSRSRWAVTCASILQNWPMAIPRTSAMI